MTTFPILIFEPRFKSVIWGGKRIAEFKGVPSQGDNIGESWELSGVPGHESVVADGMFKGKNLRELLRDHSDEIMGGRLAARFGDEFPLLIKFIDSSDDLSVQVHPDDELARKRHNCSGKTEMWVSIAPEKGAYLYSGLNRVLTPDEYRQRISDNTIIECLGKYYPEKGDVFFVLEIQETSDITYRIYDYDRRDAVGNPRQLHIEESVDAVDFSDTAGAAPSRIPQEENVQNVIADCAHFTTTAINVMDQYVLDLESRDSFTVLVVVDGNALLIDPEGNETALSNGSTTLIPAAMSGVIIRGNCNVITSYIR